MSRTATGEKRRVFAEEHIVSTGIFYFLRPKYINTKIYFAWAAEDEFHATNKCYWFFFCSLEQVWFSPLSLSESALVFLILTTTFFGGMMAIFYINEYIIARENLFYTCKIGRAPYGVRLISYNAGRALYDMWPRKKKILKIVRSNSPVIRNTYSNRNGQFTW